MQPISYITEWLLSQQSVLSFFPHDHFTSHQCFVSVYLLNNIGFILGIMTGGLCNDPANSHNSPPRSSRSSERRSASVVLLLEFYDLTLHSQVHRPTAYHCKESCPQWGALCNATVYSTDADGVWWRYATQTHTKEPRKKSVSSETEPQWLYNSTVSNW